MQNRTCKLCGHKDSSETMTHKGQGKFHCKDTQECNSRRLDRLEANQANIGTKRYVVTTAVIGCPATPALRTLENYCKLNNAELIVLTIKYKNIEKSDGYISDWLDSDLAAYALYSKRQLSPEIQLLGDIQISPTAVNPLIGLAPICKGLTTIFPSTQLAQQSIPTAKNKRAIQMWGTGCITEPIYSDSKAGYKGEFHHAISALVIEIDAECDYYIRNLPISSKDNTLIDLGVTYYPESKRTTKANYLLSLGDIHVGSHCPDNHKAINDLVAEMGTAEAIVLHDVFDGATINHHEQGNPFAQLNRPFDSLSNEIEANLNYLNYVANNWGNKVYVVDSNHHDFITKWILGTDWMTLDTETAQIYLALSLAVMSKKATNLYLQALESLGEYLNPAITFLNPDESLVVFENELGNHGHLGGNGARGSKNTWVNSGMKTITGHTHSPFIDKSAFGNGTSTYLTLGYTKGLSSWSNTHTIEYSNGKRQQFSTYKAKYRA